MPAWKACLLNSLEAPIRIARGMVNPVAGIFLRAYYLAGLRKACRGRIPASTQFDGPVYMTGTGRLVLGEYCRLGRGVVFETEGDGVIVIGSHVRINDGCTIVAHDRVAIGDDTLIGEYVSIRDANHGMSTHVPMRLQANESASVTIGQNVWIGRGACVLKGVVLADGAVIGANSVVTRSVSEDMVVGGVPARALGQRKGDV